MCGFRQEDGELKGQRPKLERYQHTEEKSGYQISPHLLKLMVKDKVTMLR